MAISFIEIPSEHWTHTGDGHKFPALFHQLRLSESRISNGVNAAVERKRHHKICTVIENTARVLIDEGNARTALELPLDVANIGTVPSSSFLQLTELLMATTNKIVTSIGKTNAPLEGSRDPQWLRYLKQIVRYLMGLFSHDKGIASMGDGSSINLPFNPISTLEIDNHWLSRFSDTPEEIVSKYALFELLHDGTFEQYFGSLMDTEVNGYKPMLRHLVQTYKSAAKRGAGIIVVVNVDVD